MLETLMWLQIQQAGLGARFWREYRFAPPRRWAFDMASPDDMLAVELEGGLYVGGRHSRGQGAEADMVKYATAAVMGWRVLRFSSGMVSDGSAIATTRCALKTCVHPQGELLQSFCCVYGETVLVTDRTK